MGVGAGAAVLLLRRSSRWAAMRASLRSSSAPSAAAYEHLFDRVLAAFFERVADDMATVLTAPPVRILEVGPGPGALPVLLARRFPGAVVDGVDIDEEMVERATARASREGLAERIHIQVGDVAHLPFADASCDVVVSTFSVHHWTDPARGFAEVRRVLRPGGHALVYDLPDRWGRFEAHARPLADAALSGGWTGATSDAFPWPWRRLSVVRRLHLVRRAEGG